jgi:nitroimidazol reductase NimA-like FMN-containing flavoprotein (pyridoxamine 5'-phosphate oxidase superfamily)
MWHWYFCYSHAHVYMASTPDTNKGEALAGGSFTVTPGSVPQNLAWAGTSLYYVKARGSTGTARAVEDKASLDKGQV